MLAWNIGYTKSREREQNSHPSFKNSISAWKPPIIEYQNRVVNWAIIEFCLQGRMGKDRQVKQKKINQSNKRFSLGGFALNGKRNKGLPYHCWSTTYLHEETVSRPARKVYRAASRPARRVPGYPASIQTLWTQDDRWTAPSGVPSRCARPYSLPGQTSETWP